MDAPNNSRDQEMEGVQGPSELPILNDKNNSPETSCQVPPLVGEKIRLEVFLLTIAVPPFTAGNRKKTYLGD